MRVTDYRTAVSGILPRHINDKSAISFHRCQQEVSDMIQDKLLVGHAINNDLQVLLLSHPKHLIRDTAYYRRLCPDRPKSLKSLAAEFLQQTIHTAAHNPIEDARIALELYKKFRNTWEKDLTHKETRKHNANPLPPPDSSLSLIPCSQCIIR